jgi:hypothetical protein
VLAQDRVTIGLRPESFETVDPTECSALPTSSARIEELGADATSTATSPRLSD